jgi:hypothetical protein
MLPAPTRRFFWLAPLLAALLSFGIAGATQAATCTAEDFAAAVDKSGSVLRAYNSEALPKLQERLAALAKAKGWKQSGYDQRAMAQIRDKHTAKLDTQAEDLLLKLDTLGRTVPTTESDCAKVAELEAATLELLAVMKAKSAYTLSKLDAAIVAAGNAKVAEPAAPKAGPGVGAEVGPKVARTQPPEQATPAPPKPKSHEPEDWSTQTRTQQERPLPPVAGLDADQGYTIDEIREITRGFFGTISTNLASVIEYAFSTSGRPSAYVLGTEGGGAFLAGVRYGKGALYLRSGGKQEVYWHGPSIGTDFGASGSRTMFLIYDLKAPERLFRQFTGIDGSAYFVGGVGITFLKGGDVIMAPIRSGLGLRLGANLGYIRFTPQPTWNPF